MKRSSILAGVLSLLALLVTAQVAAQPQWTRKNEAPDPFIRNIRVFSNTPAAGQTTLFVASLANGVVKVVDTGASQTVTALNNGLPVLRIRSVQATDATSLFVGVDSHGVYKTTDGGANWTAANGTGGGALGCLQVRNISVRSVSEVWAATACRHNSGVYRTLDGGTTWTRLGFPTIPDDSLVGSITFSGTGGSTVAVIATQHNGMFRSADNGATWAQINNGLPAPHGPNNISVFNAIFLASASEMLAYVEGHGVYRSVDSGATWAAFGTGLPATAYSLGGIQRQSATVAYLGTDKGPVYRTTDGGATWSALGNSGTNDVGQFVRSVSSDASGRLYLGGHIGLGRTTDGGSTFSFIPTGQGYASTGVLDANGKSFYIATESIYKVLDIYAPLGDTNDGGDLGIGLPGSMVGGFLDQVKSQPATFFAGLTNFGLYRTVDAGATWTRLNLPNVQVGAAPFVAVSPANSQVVYGAPGNKYMTASGGGLYTSIDGGTTWFETSVGLATPEARELNSIALHQDATSVILIATDDGIYRSSDGGGNWSPRLQFTDEQAARLPMSSVRFHPFDASIAYAAASHVNADGSIRASSGVWKSVDGGLTWTQVLSGKRTVSVRVESNGQVVVLLNRDLSQPALLASSDAGATWQPFNVGIGENDGITLTAGTREQGGKVVFTSMTTGLYVMDRRPRRLFNISTRMQVLTGNDVMIAGFIIGGSATKTVVINVAGPSLAPFGITNPLPNPTLTLVRSSDNATLGSNDDWQTQGAASVAAIEASGFKPNHALEPALIATLPPGAYTAIVEGVGGTGVGLVGVFEVDQPDMTLTNISTRGQVLTGNDRMIAGFIVQGDGPQTVVVNVAGPHLLNFGIANALLNPTLTLVRSSDQAVLATNDNWRTQTNPADVAAIEATGFQPNNPNEPAIIMTLPPGAYTAIVEGVGGSTGVALVGVFRVQ